MKILCIIDSIDSGGAQRQLLAIVRSMKRDRHDVYLAWYTDSGFYRGDMEEAGVVCIQEKQAGSMRARLRFVLKTIRRVKPDTVLAFIYTPTLLCALSKILTLGRWRLVVSIRANNEDKFRSLARILLRPLYLASNAIVCNSHAEADVWARNCRYLSSRVRVIPNYVQIPSMDVGYSMRAGGRVHILVAANLCSAIKNPLNVAGALCLLSKEERSRLRIDWYGRRTAGGMKSAICEEVERFVADNGLSDCFVTHDETHEIYEKMERADVVALFSTEEGLPNTICEGIMLGKPVIMTQVSDWKLLVQGNGAVCAGTDADSIAVILREALNWSEDDLKAMGAKSRQVARNLFDTKKITQAWRAALNGYDMASEVGDVW